MTEAFDLLFFSMRGRRCAVDVASVRQVIATPPVTPVPLVPALIRGAISFHGSPLAVLDLGVDLLPGSLEASGPNADPAARSAYDYVMIIEGNLPNDGIFARAALSVEKVMRVVPVPANLFRPAVGPPAFVSATVVDSEGPALLIDVPLALAAAMNTTRQGKHSA